MPRRAEESVEYIPYFSDRVLKDFLTLFANLTELKDASSFILGMVIFTRGLLVSCP
jgi:hypothetical protein